MTHTPPSTFPEAGAWATGRRVVVFGGTGFLGFNLTKALARAGAAVTVASRGITRAARPIPHGVSVATADLADRAALEKLLVGADAVFMLAGSTGAIESTAAPLDDIRANLVGHVNLLEAWRSVGCSARLVVGSSRLVYGRPLRNPVDESHPTEPTSAYGINKLAAEKYHRLYHELHGVRSTILRIPVAYGPDAPRNSTNHGVVRHFIDHALASRPIMLYGGGEQLRDFLFVDDLVDAMLRVSADDRTTGMVLNVGSGAAARLSELAQAVVCAAGRGEIRSAPWPTHARQVETGDFVADISRITSAIGWRPSTSLAEGVARCVRDARERAAAHAP